MLDGEEVYYNIRNDKVFSLEYSPSIDNVIQNITIEDFEKQIEQSVLTDRNYFTDDLNNLKMVNEVYIKSTDTIELKSAYITIYNKDSFRQIILNNDNAFVSNYWTDRNFIDKGVFKLNAINNSGVTTYVYMDFTKCSSENYINITSERVLDLYESYKISSYLNELSNNINITNIAENTVDIERLKYGVISYSTKNENISILREVYIEGVNSVSDYPILTLRISKSDTHRQITLLKNYDAGAISNYWTDRNFIDKGVFKLKETNNSGVTAYVLVDFTKIENAVFVRIDNNNALDINYNPSIANYLNESRINTLETKDSNKWEGKRLLAIGASITTEFEWEKK